MEQSRIVIDLLKEALRGDLCEEKIDQAQKSLSLALDRCIVNNQPTDEINALREDLLWLKCDCIGYEQT